MRQTAAEIDHGILDVAAGIFATHGFRHSSVQQIADAVGYSKPGLLHRFGSKEALHRAVVAEVSDTVRGIVARAVALKDDPDQVRQLLELITRQALERPGMAQMMLRAFEDNDTEPGGEVVRSLGHRLVDALDHPPTGPAQRLRVVLAVRLIVSAAMTQHSKVNTELHIDPDDLIAMVVTLAAEVMGGHRDVPG